MTDFLHYAASVLRRCDELAAFSEERGRLTRRFGTPALREAGETVRGWMEAAGLATRRDAIGNLIGRVGDNDRRTLLIGSHLDTVRDAGRYDGMLGVLVAIACLERLRDQRCSLPYAVEVLAFADEEGVRFGTGYLGSSVVAGCFDTADLERRDDDGVLLADAVRGFGGDPAGAAGARRDRTDLIGYYEVHIEQGPVLEGDGVPLGVVTAIAGQTAGRIVFTGQGGHAGTVPMGLRRDALAAAAEFVTALEMLARNQDGVVATVGHVEVEPGARNVIPGRVVLTLDVRHASDSVRESVLTRVRERAGAIAGARGVGLEWQVGHGTEAVETSAALTDLVAEAVAASGHPVVRLPSGAGHDAAMMSRIAPVAMLFVRCAGGVSHHPAESVTVEDVAAAIEVTTRFLELVG
ncbi:MAG TPA: allantoate amidohydrolase [Solirubrobacteraceae bacterium]|nr:allantoate amidohydrolase [Solirubrobacteraceae bacterium]